MLLLTSNSNWTFITLNLPYLKGTLRRNKTKTLNFSIQGVKKAKHYREHQGVSKTKVGMFGVQVGFELLSERG